jgi:signal transduction histidine kinase
VPVDRLLHALALPERLSDEQATLVEAAAARATQLAEAAGDAEAGRRVGTITFVAEILSGLWLERRWDGSEIDRIVREAAGLVEIAPEHFAFNVFLGTLRDPRMLELPPRLAVETRLALLVVLTPPTEASLWVPGAHGKKLVCPVHVGPGAPSRRARAAAQSALTGTERDGDRNSLHGVPIVRFGQPYAALVVRARPQDRDRALALAVETAGALVPLLEIEALLDRNAARERSLVESSERRLVRLGFDLHDGPIQDVAALAADVRLFRSQLAEVVPEPVRPLALGRVDDLEARLVALDGELRELARSIESPTVLLSPLPELVAREVDVAGKRADVDVTLALEGSFDGLTASQRFALLRIVQESLQNAHDHSSAQRVDVRLTATRGYLRAEVADDGVGFDVERTLVESAKAGRLGLVGMSERVRLLGGRLDLTSRPGGPTVVTATIPRWAPVADAEKQDSQPGWS